MNGITSFGALFAVAMGLVFVMPQSPISFLSDSLELQNPVTQLAQGFVQGGSQGGGAPGAGLFGDINEPLPSTSLTPTPTNTNTNTQTGSQMFNDSASGFLQNTNTTSGGGAGGSNSSSGGGLNVNETGSAQTGGGAGTELQNPLKVTSVKEFISVLISELVKVGYVIGVCFIVYSGFLFVTGGENDAKRTKAKNTMLWTVIGIGILLGAQAIAIIVSTTIDAISRSTV